MSVITKTERLLDVLSDGEWHSTKELVRKVGHTFALAKATLIDFGYSIEKRKHATKKWQWEYRIRGGQ